MDVSIKECPHANKQLDNMKRERVACSKSQEWEHDDQCPYTDEQIKDMEKERIASMCDIKAFEMYKEAEKRGYNLVTAVNRFYTGESQEWEQNEQCPYTDEQIKDMERERIASMCDIEAFEMYKEAEKRGHNPMIAINRFYTGETQEWDI